MGLFHKQSVNEKTQEMISTIRKQKYQVERDIISLKKTNDNVLKDIKKRAKTGSIDEVKILAKELVNSRKMVSKLYAAVAHMDTISSELKIQLATIKTARCLQNSTAVMKAMSAIVNLPEMNRTMQNMSKEMMKMGLIGEMIDDTMESALGDVDNEEVSNEVNQVLNEIFASDISKVPDVIQDSVLAETPIAGTSRVHVGEEDSTDGEMGKMQERLAALRN